MHYTFRESHQIMQFRSSTSTKGCSHILFLFLPSIVHISHIFTQTANNKHTCILTPTLPLSIPEHCFSSTTMPGKMNRPQVPLYAGPAFHHSPPASALPTPKKFIRSLSGSDVRFNPFAARKILFRCLYSRFRQAQRDEERPGDKAVPVPSDTSQKDKGAVSETENQEQDEPVDTVNVAISFIHPECF